MKKPEQVIEELSELYEFEMERRKFRIKEKEKEQNPVIREKVKHKPE